MAAGYTSTITILRPGVVESDHASEPVLDHSDPERIEVPFLVSMQPMTSTEGPSTRPQVVSGWWLCTPAGRDLDLRPTDRVEFGSIELEVIGEVGRWPHPIRPGAVHHVEAMLERVVG